MAAKEKTPVAESDSPFAQAMRRWRKFKDKADGLKDTVKEANANADLMRDLLKEEVTALGLGTGSSLKVEGVGTFSFGSKTYYRVNAADRLKLVQLLIERGDLALLTIGDKDLNAWCEDFVATDGVDALPPYISKFTDRFVPKVMKARSPKA